MEFKPEIFSINDSSRILVLFPHPDDETFYSFGLIRYALKVGAKIKMVCLTKGEASMINVGKRNKEELASLRTIEFNNVMSFIGIKDFELLDYPDGRLTENYNAIYKHVNELLMNGEFTHLITFEPYGCYGHPDHIFTSKVALDLLKNYPETKLIYTTCGGFIRKRKTLQAAKPNVTLNLSWKTYIAKLRAFSFYRTQFSPFWKPRNLLDRLLAKSEYYLLR